MSVLTGSRSRPTRLVCAKEIAMVTLTANPVSSVISEMVWKQSRLVRARDRLIPIIASDPATKQLDLR